MSASERFDQYMAHLSRALGHADRHAGLKGYCTGLMLPLSRKSVEPMAARVDPLHASARHQALHHFVAKAQWSDVEVLRRVCQWVVPHMDFSRGGWWIIDDTGFPKKGVHSVGVARQYCGMLGKQDKCQVAVSVSLACDQGSIPVAWQLYLPQDWAQDAERRKRTGVPESVRFATKTQIALHQVRTLLSEGAPRHCVLADAGYGVDTAFRQALSARGLCWAVGIPRHQKVYPSDVQLIFPVAGRGRPRVRHVPDVKSLAAHTMLEEAKWRKISWRRGTKGRLSARFAVMRVRIADGAPQRIGAAGAQHMPGEEAWLVGEHRSSGERKYYLSNLPADTPAKDVAGAIKARWVCEQAHQQLKEELGLDHFEGRSWTGLHRHALMTMIAYAFLQTRRLAQTGRKKKSLRSAPSAEPTGCTPSYP